MGTLVALALMLAVALGGCGQDSPSAGTAATAAPGGPSPSGAAGGSGSQDPSTTGAVAPGETASPSPADGAVTDPTPSAAKTLQVSSATKTATPTPTPSATKPMPCFTVTGRVAQATTFTVARLKSLPTFSGTYFSRGKDPKEASTAFVGVRLIDILNAAGVASDAKRVTVRAADAYSASFTMRQVTADYIDETRPGVILPMIMAYSEDGVPYTGDHPFRLVMGQSVEGDYNRQYWVRIVVAVEVE